MTSEERSNILEEQTMPKLVIGDSHRAYIEGIESWDPVEWVREKQAYCFSNEMFASAYLEAIFEMAAKELTPKPKYFKLPEDVPESGDQLARPQCHGYVVRRTPSPLTTFPTLGKLEPNTFTGWPKISEFNIKLGLEKLEEYIGSWPKGDDWKSCVEFLGFESEENSNYFVYEVEFSIPTPAYPIPQATASIYFSLEVSKMVPPPYDRPIDVSYVFESSNIIHTPGKILSHEPWMKKTVLNKIALFKTLTF